MFNHPEKRLELNAIIHPIVRDIMEEEKQEYLKQDMVLQSWIFHYYLKMNWKIQ